MGNWVTDQHTDVDWEAIERSDEFQELVRSKRAFVAPRTLFFLGWYLGFILLAGYAPGFMGESVYQGLTVGYVLALTQFVMVWYLAATYLRKADRDFEPLERRALESAAARGGTDERDATGRFERKVVHPRAAAAIAEGHPVIAYRFAGVAYDAVVINQGADVAIIGNDDGIPTIINRAELLEALGSSDRETLPA